MAAARTPPSAHAPREPRWAQMDRHALVSKKELHTRWKGALRSGGTHQGPAAIPLSLGAFAIELVTAGHN